MGKCDGRTCGISCEGACTCMIVGDEHTDCECWCHPWSSPPVPRGMNKSDPEKMIKFFVCDEMPLSSLGYFFDNLFPEQILIPASKVNTQVTTQLENIKIGDLIEELGLVVVKKPLVGRDLGKDLARDFANEMNEKL
ncbi:hypothetical protein [Paenibacillus sp. UMB4589-SE434]|uniref:hypothetical protein n=1 Tax=Paenibacillus sp. UMB4589-SE434 TaxID=3046314 RepID=UPI00254DACD8|nr:hypothetical protein [Paenibacillus sp. UMB4589-SE434]MDK8181727.1 hypothetical protein [Paenibacillus sp. UMB4589-SE434]